MRCFARTFKLTRWDSTKGTYISLDQLTQQSRPYCSFTICMHVDMFTTLLLVELSVCVCGGGGGGGGRKYMIVSRYSCICLREATCYLSLIRDCGIQNSNAHVLFIHLFVLLCGSMYRTLSTQVALCSGCLACSMSTSRNKSKWPGKCLFSVIN